MTVLPPVVTNLLSGIPLKLTDDMFEPLSMFSLQALRSIIDLGKTIDEMLVHPANAQSSTFPNFDGELSVSIIYIDDKLTSFSNIPSLKNQILLGIVMVLRFGMSANAYDCT